MSASHTSYEIQDKYSGAVVCFAAFIKLAALSYLLMILLIMYYVAKDYWLCVGFFNEKVTKYVPWRHEKITVIRREYRTYNATQRNCCASYLPLLIPCFFPASFCIEKVPFVIG